MVVDPATDRVVGSTGFGSIAGEMVMVALDHRFVTTLQGDLLAVNNAGGLDQTDVPRITRAALLGGPDTFAAGDTAVIVVASSGEQLHTGAISALLLQGRRSVALGIADEAAGDPQALGAFVSVALPGASSEVPVGGYLGLPDSRVELRDAGQPASVLATAAQLNAALGQPKAQPVHLSVFPNPAGTAVAVMLDPPLGADRNVSVVVLDRAGRVIGRVPAAVGPVQYSWLSWSPDGRSLAYQTGAPSGTSLAVWREGARPSSAPRPTTGPRSATASGHRTGPPSCARHRSPPTTTGTRAPPLAVTCSPSGLRERRSCGCRSGGPPARTCRPGRPPAEPAKALANGWSRPDG